MDDSTFDRIARRLGGGASRRSVVAAALAAAGGAAAAADGDVAAKGCPKGKKRCGGKCVNVKKSRKHCGHCHTKCADGERCKRGKCTPKPQECDVCSSGCPFTSVQDAIDAASAGDTVTVCAGTFAEQISIHQDLTLVGQGDGDGANDTILQGDGSATVVSVTGGEVELQKLRITGGGGAANGGGVNNAQGATLTLAKCTLFANTLSGTARGGGAYNNGVLSLLDASVIANNANFGGGLYNDLLGSLKVNDSTVNSNGPADDDTGQGGGIFNAGDLNVDGGEIVGNTALLGGGIFNAATPATAATANLADCTLTTNEATSGDTGLAQGGGIYNAGTMTLDGVTVFSNKAEDAGGGVFNDGEFGFGTISCTNGSTVADNNPDNCLDDAGGTGCNTCPVSTGV